MLHCFLYSMIFNTYKDYKSRVNKVLILKRHTAMLIDDLLPMEKLKAF